LREPRISVLILSSNKNFKSKMRYSTQVIRRRDFRAKQACSTGPALAPLAGQ
jgi:hypothetical protein